ncbi:helix-turn-helix transcriptional regulator [Luxibacter massiliensis]|uniref:helix-turn-helix transcriptional regulator n=1 Tax=Luxibacter massiliensis TaxID=2219695 RepID=UPI000F06398B|nr:helix-turn-helix transcriptional regulator [Luxibacter massiliensis]
MTSNISENIRILRKNSGMTQEQLAKRLFITRQALSNYENGSRLPNLLTAIAIANVFNISLDILSGRKVK